MKAAKFSVFFTKVNIEGNLSIGRRIRRRRQALGITQATLADLAGLSRHSITDIESGKGNPTLDVLGKLLAPLGLKLAIELAEPNLQQEKAQP